MADGEGRHSEIEWTFPLVSAAIGLPRASSLQPGGDGAGEADARFPL